MKSRGVRLFAFGGARFHDISDGILDPHATDWKTQKKNLKRRKKKNYRVKGTSWWEAELPTEYLEEIKEKLKYRQWYFGHYHRDYQITMKDNLLYEWIIRIL